MPTIASLFAPEAARIGGLTQTTISGTCRADSECYLSLCLYSSPDVQTVNTLLAESERVHLNVDNNFQGTCYITDLNPGQTYYYHFRLSNADNTDDRRGNLDSVYQASGSFKTLSATPTPTRIAFMGCNQVNPSTYDWGKMYRAWNTLNDLGIDHAYNLGDIYYSDTYAPNDVPLYEIGAWRNTGVSNHSSAKLENYRTNCISTWGEMLHRNYPDYYGEFLLNTPHAWMWDDHDRGWNDMNGVQTWNADMLARANMAKQAGHEAFMNMNAVHITNEGREWIPNVTDDDWFFVDYFSTRVIVINCRIYRDSKLDPDVPTKTMLGATQFQWVKDSITDFLTTNPDGNIVIASPLMFDGYHGWNEEPTDSWTGYTYERDELLNWIFANWDTNKFCIMSCDTHAGAVAVYDDDYNGGDDTKKIYEVLAGNLWEVSYHDFINGWKGGEKGTGGRLLQMQVNEPNVSLIDMHTDGSLTLSLIGLYSQTPFWSHTIGK